MLSKEETIKAYLQWLDLGLLQALCADGNKQKTLAGWQLQAKIVLKWTEKQPKTSRKTLPLKQLKEQAKKLSREDQRCIIEDLAKIGLIEGQELIYAI